jgi:8-oxo-dGTP pyrophosphatase MutT (NUDIX family)|tara:strand:- start:55 stop:675 length:621 start_codon:yes stop_codon:yes gene_type:complete
VEFENLIFHLKQRMNNALPGEDSHKKMKVNFSNNTKLPFSKNKAKPAAVLILLYPNNDKTYFYLTKRADTVKYHKGQISLPGGSKENNETLLDTALRETQEEIGIDKNEISILGKITPLFIPVTGFMITPFVSYISKKPKTILDEIEVAELLSINIRDLLNNDILIMDRDINGSSVSIPYFSLNNHQVWGATSMVLSELKDIIQLV